jgi:hypothetical protein
MFPYCFAMGKRTHNQGKADDLLYRSVHAGRLSAGHHVADGLLADRPLLIDWHNEIAAELFRPNPLVPMELSMQTMAKQASKGAPWFSGYAQNFACDVGTKVSHVEEQLKQRISRWLAACGEKAPEKRIPKRDRGKPQAPARKYIHVPMDVEGTVTAADFAAVIAFSGRVKSACENDSEDDADDTAAPKKKAAPAPWVKLCAEACEAMLAADLDCVDQSQPEDAEIREAVLTAAARAVLGEYGLNPAQAAIVADVCLRAFRAYSCPVFGRVGPNGTDRFVLRLELDARGYADTDLRNKPEVFRSRVGEAMKEAWLAKRKVFNCEVNLVGLRNRQGDPRPPLALPISVCHGVWNTATMDERLKKTEPNRMPTVRNLSLEIARDHVDVRLNIDHQRRTPDIAKTRNSQTGKLTDAYLEALLDAINARTVLLGRDIGFVNTVSYGAVLRDRQITKEDLLNTVNLKTKEKCLEHIQTHWHPAEPLHRDGKPVLMHYEGRDFLDCIADHAAHIDVLRSAIDLNIGKMRYFKSLLFKPLGLNSQEAHIPDAYHARPGKPATLVHADTFVQYLIAKFFRIFDLTQKLKELRRDVYRKVDAVKRCWFGWLSSVEAEMATALNAVVVRENATFVAIPTGNPKYKGRTFNKMLNNGARALYERIASDKLAWLGIPEIRIPSPYTSLADLRASTVSETKRRGETFIDAYGVEWHADEHAALTISAWPLLRAGKSGNECRDRKTKT